MVTKHAAMYPRRTQGAGNNTSVLKSDKSPRGDCECSTRFKDEE